MAMCSSSTSASSVRSTASQRLTVAWAGAKGTHLVLSQGYTGTGINRDQLPDAV